MRNLNLPTACQKSEPLPYKLSQKTRKLLKIKWQDRIPDTEVLKREGMQSVHTLLNMLPECLMNVCQRKSFMESYKSGNAPMVVRRSDTRAPSKPPLKTLTYQQSRGNKLHMQDRAKWRGLIRRGAGKTKQKESAKPSKNVRSGKPELRHHQQSFLPQTSLVLSATDSLELSLVPSAILEHTNNNTSRI